MDLWASPGWIAAVPKGFGFGLLVAAFSFGFRHGIDWDHIAAITDITGAQEERRHAIWLGTMYALGHASVVLALGVLAIVAGERLPAGIDEAMARVVGITLLLLGVYVVVSLVRHGPPGTTATTGGPATTITTVPSRSTPYPATDGGPPSGSA